MHNHACIRRGIRAVNVAVGLVRVRTNRGLVTILGNSSARSYRNADSNQKRTIRGAVLRRRVIRLGCGADLACGAGGARC